MKDFKFSIITINFNNKKGLEKTIQSVLMQDYKNIEYIVIDGGSTDGSKKVIETYQDNINYWVSEPDKGIYNAMNKGVEQATGDYYLFLNSADTLVSSDVVSKVNDALKEKLVDLLTGIQRAVWGKRTTYHNPPEYVTFFYMMLSTLPHQTTFISKKLFENKKYDESMKISADKKFFVTTILEEKATYAKIDLLVTDFDTSGTSSKFKNSDIQAKEDKECIIKYLNEGEQELYNMFLNREHIFLIRRRKIVDLIFRIREFIRLYLGK